MNSNTAARRDRYILTTGLFVIIFPVISICAEAIIKGIPADPGLMGKWLIFWVAGIRLSLRGIKRIYRRGAAPAIFFNEERKETFLMIRELSFANITIGVMGILSVVNSNWRQIAGLAAAIFFGLSALQHFFIKPVNGKEMAIMVTDIIVFAILLLYLFFTLGYVDGCKILL